MLKVKLQYFGHVMRTSDSLEKKTLMLEKMKKTLMQKEKWVTEDEMVKEHH